MNRGKDRLGAGSPPGRIIAWAGMAGLLVSGAAIAQAAGPDPEWTYRVIPGDTLSNFARDYLAPGVSWQKLQGLNRVTDPRRLTPGRTLRMPLAWLRAEATVATAVFVRGAAQRERAGSAAPLAVGGELRPGDVLVTEAGASVTLRLADTSRVLVAGGSRVRMESLLVLGRSGVTSSRLGIEQGEAESRITPGVGSRYEIRTPVMTLGVRGTEFRVRVGDAAVSALAEVTQGQVAVRATAVPGAEQPIAAGFGIWAEAGRGLSSAQPLLPPPVLGDLPTLQDRVPLRFAWPPLAGAAGYRAQIFASGTSDERLLDGAFAGPAAQWADLPDGPYLLRVRARDAQGLEGASTDAPFTLKARPEPPFTSEPRDGARVHGERVELGWTKSLVAQRYRVQIAGAAGFEAPALDRDDLDADRLAVALPPGAYAWRIAAIAAGGDRGPYSDANRFELAETPPAPTLDAPALQGGQLVFRWRARQADDRYELQVASDQAFTQLVADRQVDRPELVLAELPAGRYYLRVRTIEAGGFKGPFGAAQQFEVPRGPWWWLVPGAALLLLWL